MSWVWIFPICAVTQVAIAGPGYAPAVSATHGLRQVPGSLGSPTIAWLLALGVAYNCVPNASRGRFTPYPEYRSRTA